MRKYAIIGYSLAMLLIVIIDRISKIVALRCLVDSYKVTSWLSFDLVMNRGISWSLFHSASTFGFVVLSVFIMIIIGILMVHTMRRLDQGESIFGEILALSGALSNVLDRLLYGGVVDFIVLSVGDWTWPVFNIADCSIVVGIGIMFVTFYKKL